MKKLFIIMLALVVSVGTLFASKVKIGDLYYNLNDNNKTAEVTGQYSFLYYTTVQIPASVQYMSVTYSVTSIGNEAFYYCDNLTHVTIPNSVTSIGSSAFKYCGDLGGVTMGDNVTSIGESAFESCGLQSVIIPVSVTSIGKRAFCACDDLSSVTMYNNVTSIGDEAFSGCDLRSVTIPVGVISIGNGAFQSNIRLKTVTIGENVTSIGNGAFQSCTHLTSLTIGNSVTSIGDRAFQSCDSLTFVKIPNKVTSIGSRAFFRTGLTCVIIPKSVTSIGNEAFATCDSLRFVYVDSDNPNYTSVDGILFNKDQSSLIQYPGKKQGSYKITSSVTNIENRAFYNCSGLTSIEIPNSVISIGNYAFFGCSGLTSVTIPNSVTSIGEYAFGNCSGLTAISNYATTPQTIVSYVFYNVNKNTCTLRVPEESVDLYSAAKVWKDFGSIVGVDVPVETEEDDYAIQYLDKESDELHHEIITLHVPVAPIIEGFTFLKWQASGDLEDGIILQAVYQSNTPTEAPEVVANPANPAQKLIRNGNVYILTGDKTYTLTGQEVR